MNNIRTPREGQKYTPFVFFLTSQLIVWMEKASLSIGQRITISIPYHTPAKQGICLRWPRYFLWLPLILLFSACSTQKPTTPAPVVKPSMSEVIKKPTPSESLLPPSLSPPTMPDKPLEAKEPAIAVAIPNPLSLGTETSKEPITASIPQGLIKEAQKNLKKVVVLLPDRPSLAEVNRDIEKGIRTAHQQHGHNPHLQLLFLHDTLSGEALMNKANAFNPDWIIGPLTKTDIQSIQHLTTDRHIFLNRLDTPTQSLQIGLPAEDEIDQLLTQFHASLGDLLVISSNDSSEQRLVSYLNSQAKAKGINLTLVTLEKQNPDIRDWLMREGGINAGLERIKRLTQLVKGDFSDTIPHAKQDIQGVVFLGNAKQLRSIMPSLAYYRVSWPVYATSRLLPSKAGEPFNEPELNGVKVLAPPYLLNQQAPTGLFEALGWDSYLLLANPQAQMVQTQTGKLIHQNNQLYRQLTWHVIKDGQLSNMK